MGKRKQERFMCVSGGRTGEAERENIQEKIYKVTKFTKVIERTEKQLWNPTGLSNLLPQMAKRKISNIFL